MLCYKENRDKDFFDNCLIVEKELHSQLQNNQLPAPDNQNRRGYIISPQTIIKAAIMRQAKSFYLADAYQILKIYKKTQLIPELPDTPRGALYRDIRTEFLRLRSLHPEKSLMDIAEIIEDQPAPRFYISFNWAQCVYYQIKRKQHGKK